MKTRTKFVSNSSSSSFILIHKNKSKPILECLQDCLRINQSNALFNLVEKLINKIDSSITNATNILDANEDNEDWQIIKEALDNKYKVYVGKFQDGGYGAEYTECLLCEMDLNIDNNDITMIHHGGY